MLAMFREAMKQQGNNQYTKSKCNNVTPADSGKGTGNDRAYSVTRVQQQCKVSVTTGSLFVTVAIGRICLSLVGMQSPGRETKLPSLHSSRFRTSPADIKKRLPLGQTCDLKHSHLAANCKQKRPRRSGQSDGRNCTYLSTFLAKNRTRKTN